MVPFAAFRVTASATVLALVALSILIPGMGLTDAAAQARTFTRADTLRGSITP